MLVEFELEDFPTPNFVFSICARRNREHWLETLPDMQRLGKKTPLLKLSQDLLLYTNKGNIAIKLLPQNVLDTLNKFKKVIDVIHLSDQNSQPMFTNSITPSAVLQCKFVLS